MNNLLSRWLTKNKINNVSELKPDEKETFDRWERILSEGEMSVDKIKQFCQNQLSVIEGQLKNVDNTPQKNERLVIYFNIYKTIINIINSPMAERESLEQYLNQLLK